MIPTMLPSGGVVNPFNPFRPSGGASKEDQMTPDQVTAARLAIDKGLTQENWLDYLSKLSKEGNTAATEKLLDYYSTEQSLKTARDWTAQREDSAWQRTVEDLKKAGISPYFLSGGSPLVSSSSGHGYTGSQMTSSSNNLRTQGRSMITALLAGLGIILSATIRAGTAGLL